MTTETPEFDGSETQPIPGLADTLEVLRAKVDEERRANDLKVAELEQRAEEVAELRRQNELSTRQESWLRELATQAGRAVEEMGLARADMRHIIDAIGAAFREWQVEQAEVNDALLDSTGNIKDALAFVLTRYVNGRRLGGDLEAVKKELTIRRENLNKLRIKAAQQGEPDLATQNQIEAEQDRVNRLEAQIIISSLGGK